MNTEFLPAPESVYLDTTQFKRSIHVISSERKTQLKKLLNHFANLDSDLPNHDSFAYSYARLSAMVALQQADYDAMLAGEISLFRLPCPDQDTVEQEKILRKVQEELMFSNVWDRLEIWISNNQKQKQA
ncbi:MAG: hypothetical protein LUE86_08295 [Clostridiales bacterium]|nr:hypothetical protein [Clostridiales bacterium]